MGKKSLGWAYEPSGVAVVYGNRVKTDNRWSDVASESRMNGLILVHEILHTLGAKDLNDTGDIMSEWAPKAWIEHLPYVGKETHDSVNAYLGIKP